jgi:AcrR family transcriptional regulator
MYRTSYEYISGTLYEMSTKAPRLSRETIAATALAIADAEGFSAVSMRRVAQELNVGTMSLYYHVKTKDDLIAVMDDALMSEALVPSLPRRWQDAIIKIATRTHDLYLRHPWALAAMISAPPGLNAMRHMEQCLEALSRTKMTAQQKLTLLAMVDDFVFGHALREAASDATIDLAFAKTQLATGAFPRLTEAFGTARICPSADRFQLGLRILIDGNRSGTK